MEESNSKYYESLKELKLPIIVLDNKWHKLFEGRKKPAKVKKLEQELEELIKKQGQCNTELKELKKLKTKLMEEIVENMETSQNQPGHSKAAKKMEDNQRLIKEINEKMEECEDRLIELPGEIRDKNLDLMVVSMEACYRFLHKNGEDIYTIEQWVEKVRSELNKNLLIKEEREAKNLQIYTYMYQILGPRILDLFDMKYLKGWSPPQNPDEEVIGDESADTGSKEGEEL
jgi:hypothetical protein